MAELGPALLNVCSVGLVQLPPLIIFSLSYLSCKLCMEIHPLMCGPLHYISLKDVFIYQEDMDILRTTLTRMSNSQKPCRRV